MKTRQDMSAKPYYKCFLCHRFRSTCGGRPTREMTLLEWCEYMRDIRDYFGLSNDYITEKAESSAKTTERIMALNTEHDIMRSTARKYEMAEIGPVGEFTCYLDQGNQAADQMAALQAETAALREEVAYWRKENERKAKIIDKYLEI